MRCKEGTQSSIFTNNKGQHFSFALFNCNQLYLYPPVQEMRNMFCGYDHNKIKNLIEQPQKCNRRAQRELNGGSLQQRKPLPWQLYSQLIRTLPQCNNGTEDHPKRLIPTSTTFIITMTNRTSRIYCCKLHHAHTTARDRNTR